MRFERAAGILLHPTSLPGPFGIGDLGPQAHRWIDFLAQAGCSLWQTLPLGPTSFGDSPYQCFSAFAGNPYLVSPQVLLVDGLLVEADLEDKPDFPSERVAFGELIPWKIALLDRAYRRFKARPAIHLADEFCQFQADQATWLDDYALFMALKDAHGGASWNNWEAPVRDRQPPALAQMRLELAEAIERHAFWQFLFFRQWQALRQYAHQRGVGLIGDAPIFVAHDSADVWSYPKLFYLDSHGRPKVVAGVPPDYYSPTGQLWGNPHYRWSAHQASGYAWWIARLRSVLGLVDWVRLDHFRGFAAYWQVSGKAQTAEHGRWVRAPGADFLRAVKNALGDLPIIAEDLGMITPDVVKLRQAFNLPGMKVLQFAFGDHNPQNPFLPHNYLHHCVVYTGTHDNDTACGWYERILEDEKSFCRRYLARSGHDVAWDLIRACWSSVAVVALAPIQDFLSLGNAARMNYPGNPSGNWAWRMAEGVLTDGLAERIKEMNVLYSRMNTRPGL